MTYSGFIEALLAEAVLAKKTGDSGRLAKMLAEEDEPVKRTLLETVCCEEFLGGVCRNSDWFKKQKNRLELIALGEPCEDEREETMEIMSKVPMKKFQEKQKRKDAKGSLRSLSYMKTRNLALAAENKDEEIREIENKILSKIPDSLKRLARMIGRTGGSGAGQGKGFSRASKSDISGITVGNDLNSLLPKEVAFLSSLQTQDIFYKNYAEKKLQVFSSASSCEEKKDRRDGPVIICLDTSSSMAGEPLAVAKMLTVAVSIYAMRRKRKILVVKYSDECYHQVFTKRVADRERLMKFLNCYREGCNDENVLFRFIFTEFLPEEPAYDAADILCISDFGWTQLEEDVEDLISKAKAGGMKFYGLAVGCDSKGGHITCEAIENCDSKWLWDNGECIES